MKLKFLLIPLAVLSVQFCMAQGNPNSTNSQNTAGIAINSGEYVGSYDLSYHFGLTAVYWTFTDDTTIGWKNGAGGQWTQEWVDDIYGPSDEVFAGNWLASSWPQAVPEGTGGYTANGVFLWPGTRSLEPFPYEHCDASFGMINGEFTPPGTETYHKDADTKLTLATGGAPGSTRMNLWMVTASAATNVFGPGGETTIDDIPVEGAAGDVPPQQIRVGVFGYLDAGGHAYMVLPDNTNVDCTPYVAGLDHYTFTEPPTEYPLAITANGVTLDPDTVTNGADFCVGQGISFGITGLDPYRNQTDDFAKWKLPGTFVNTNSDPNCDLYYTTNTALLSRHYSTDGTISTFCWYVLDATNVTVSVTVFYDTRPGGTIFTQILAGKFNVHRPTITDTNHYPDGTPTAQILSGTLSLGVSGVTNDMSFSHTVTTDGFTSGQVGYFQLVGGKYTAAFGNLVDIEGTNGIPDTELDNNEPTRGPFSISANTNKMVVFQDAPSDPLFNASSASMDVQFSTYLMFKPSGGIWVPLRLITWGLNDEAANGAVFSGSASITSDGDCTTFPDWKNVFHNSGF